MSAHIGNDLSNSPFFFFWGAYMPKKSPFGRKDELCAAAKEYFKATEKVLFNLFNLERALKGLPLVEPEPNTDIRLPRPSDFLEENIRRRQIDAIRKTIKRQRKLSAEKLWEIIHLRDKQGLTWVEIAGQMEVCEKAVRKGYAKAKAALATRKEPWEL
jgi:hypothetical protein